MPGKAVGSLDAIAAGNNPASGDTFWRSDNGVRCKLAKWLQELYKKGRITEDNELPPKKRKRKNDDENDNVVDVDLA